MALDMARCEWAQVEAFDAPEKSPLTADDLLGKDPAATRLKLQPGITLLGFSIRWSIVCYWPWKKRDYAGEVSNATDSGILLNARCRSATAGLSVNAVAYRCWIIPVFITQLDPSPLRS